MAVVGEGATSAMYGSKEIVQTEVVPSHIYVNGNSKKETVNTKAH